MGNANGRICHRWNDLRPSRSDLVMLTAGHAISVPVEAITVGHAPIGYRVRAISPVGHTVGRAMASCCGNNLGGGIGVKRPVGHSEQS